MISTKALKARDANRTKILAKLVKSPATNHELNRICLRYGARIFELRQAGHAIKTTNLGKGAFLFTLSLPCVSVST